MMTYWYVHLLMSNLNWIFTTMIHIGCSVYHISSYAMRYPESESQNLQISFLFLMGIFHVVYIMLTYFSDYNQKLNYCNEYVLKKV